MIVDLAHASTESIRAAVKIAHEKQRPVLASHTGVKNHLSRLYAGTADAGKLQAIRRAMSAHEIKMIAGTGGTTGIIYWRDQIGEARVDNVVDAIMQAYCDLAALEGTRLPAASTGSKTPASTSRSVPTGRRGIERDRRRPCRSRH